MTIHINSYGSGIPLVFFHGWGFDQHIWLPIIPYLHENYQLILIDLPGFGLTPMVSWEDFKKELLTRLPAQFALIGWSLGGLYATRLAIEEPHKIMYLLNVTSSPCFISDSEWPGVSQTLFANFHHNLSRDINKTLKDFISLQKGKSQLHLNSGNPPSVAGLESGLKILETWDFREELKNLTVPTHYIFGRLDPITPIKTMMFMQVHYPQFKYVLFNKSAHMPFLSHTELFIEEISGYIL